jgi:ribonucleases P/MRP protein subunit RPP40
MYRIRTTYIHDGEKLDQVQVTTKEVRKKLNNKYEYRMNGELLATAENERDIGIEVHQSLKPANQCAKAAATARIVLGQISRAFHYRDKQTFVKLYITYVRPHLEFSTPAWSP